VVLLCLAPTTKRDIIAETKRGGGAFHTRFVFGAALCPDTVYEGGVVSWSSRSDRLDYGF
jgi:3-mercaptopyruvate sulfurtransferase SseA